MYTRVVNANAARKESFHCCDGSVRVLTGATTNELIRPDAPRMSPLNRRRVAAERPMREPPISPDMGVKYCRDMLLLLLRLCYDYDYVLMSESNASQAFAIALPLA